MLGSDNDQNADLTGSFTSMINLELNGFKNTYGVYEE